MNRHDANLTTERPTFVTHLECGYTGERHPAAVLRNLSLAGKPLLVRYDLDGVRKALDKSALAARPADLWRYRELLPVRNVANIVSLGEVMTPLIPLPRSAGDHVLVKDESRLPTGSFKARGVALAISMAKELGVAETAMPTNGNAGAALAAYASRAGIRATVFCPDDTPVTDEARAAGLHFLFEGAVMDGIPIFNLVRETMPGVTIPCRVCAGPAAPAFDATVLGRHRVRYFQCPAAPSGRR